MPSRLITTWTENDEFLLLLLGQATHSIRVFDADLSKLRLDNSLHTDVLRRLLAADRNNRVHIVLRNAEPLRRNGARLLRLLSDNPGALTIQECAPHLVGLSDSIVIVDDRHALIRFHPDSPRARTIVDHPGDCRPYRQRFDEIVEEGGEVISATTLGL